MAGQLTIRGVTRPVALEVAYSNHGPAPATARLTACGVLQRKDFGLDLGPLLETAGLAIGEKVKLEVEVSLREAAP